MDYDALNLTSHCRRRGYVHQNGGQYHHSPYYGHNFVSQDVRVHPNGRILGNDCVYPTNSAGMMLWDHPGRHSCQEGIRYHHSPYADRCGRYHGYRHQHIQPIAHERPMLPYDYCDPRMMYLANGYYHHQRPMPVADDFTHLFNDDNTRGCSIM